MVRVAELIDALVDAGTAQTATAAIVCHHCGEALARVEVRCRRCGTAYHLACFTGARGCTLYPCSCATSVAEEADVPALAPGRN